MTRRIVRPCAAALSLLACLALLSAQPALAQDRGRSPSGKELYEAYPLDPSPQGDADRGAEPAPTATAEPAPTATAEPAPRATADPAGRRQETQSSIQLVVVAVLAVLAFVAGFVLAVRPIGRRRKLQRDAVAASRPAATLAGESPSLSALPPFPERAWMAEIEWREDKSCFCVTARARHGGGTATVMRSPPLEWPPKSPEAVQALREAADALEAALVAAGWTALPPGDAWWAKCFAWEPVASPPESLGQSGRFQRAPSAETPVNSP